MNTTTERAARDYRGNLCPMPTPKGKGWRMVKRYDGPVELWQRSRNRFAVVYGLQIDDGLSYAQACEKLGQALMHALTCEGELDA